MQNRFSRKSHFKSEFSNGRHSLSFEDRHLIFWILGPLLYHSRIVFQPNFKSGSRADIQGGRNLPPPDLTRKKQPGSNRVKYHLFDFVSAWKQVKSSLLFELSHIKEFNSNLMIYLSKNFTQKNLSTIIQLLVAIRAKIDGAGQFQVRPPLEIRFPYVYAKRQTKE